MTTCVHCQGTIEDWATGLNFCELCGKPRKEWLATITQTMDCLQVRKRLPDAVRLILKVEFTEAARNALIEFENVLRSKSKLQGNGVDLVSRSFSFEYDAKQKKITRAPLVAFGDLDTDTGRNEQEGMLNLALGVVKALRNPLIHEPTDLHAFRSVSIVTMVSFLLERISEGGSILKQKTVRLSASKRAIDPTAAAEPGVDENRVRLLLTQVRNGLKTYEFEGVVAAAVGSVPISRSLEAVQFLLARRIIEIVTRADATNDVYVLTPIGERLRTLYFDSR